MRTDTEMMNLILQIGESLRAEAVALSGSRINPQTQEDEFQDYDVVYIVDNLEDLISDLSWLDQFGMRLIEQQNVLGHRRLYLMLFEDGNRIDFLFFYRNFRQAESSLCILYEHETNPFYILLYLHILYIL